MTKEENNIIEIVDENGEVILCEVFTIIEFEEKDYALLIPKNQKDDPEADLNFIDTSLITSMNSLFDDINFDGDIFPRSSLLNT